MLTKLRPVPADGETGRCGISEQGCPYVAYRFHSPRFNVDRRRRAGRRHREIQVGRVHCRHHGERCLRCRVRLALRLPGSG